MTSLNARAIEPMPVPVRVVYGRYSGETQRGNKPFDRQLDLEHYRNRASELGLPFIEVPFSTTPSRVITLKNSKLSQENFRRHSVR
jgi:hypothetical protein